MSEQPEQVTFTEQDVEDLKSLGVTAGEEPSFHTVLEVWREVLKPAEEEKTHKPQPQFCNRITQSYREINFADMIEYRDRYFDKILELAGILAEVIESDDQCLTYTTPEEDVEHNSQHYKTLLLEWQKRFIVWENEWDCQRADAAVELAAISEVHKMFFSQTGITAYLEQIQFQFTEQDQAELAAELESVKETK